MIAVNYSQVRENMKTYMDKATNDFETIIVTRKEKNVVIISEEVFNNLLENAYLLKDKANFDWLMESKKQLDSGKIESHQLIEEEK